MNFPRLSPAQIELLALLSEELGEAQQAVGKILRHGYFSTHPDGGLTNRASLEKELGDVRLAMILLFEAGDLDRDAIDVWIHAKRQKVGQYLHHNTVKK